MPGPTVIMSVIGAGSVAVVTAVAAMAYAVRGRSSSYFGPSVYRGDRSRPSLALTFDDGPSESTPALLEILRRHHVRATFFMCGQNVTRLPEIARQVANEGHEIGNHSDSHPRFDFRSRAFIYREIAATQEKIERNTGVSPKLFRAPYGVRWFGVGEAQKRLGLLGVMWTVIGHDWRWPAHRIANLLTRRSRNGDIICLHDGRRTEPQPDIRATLSALEMAIPALLQREFQFETVSEILCFQDPVQTSPRTAMSSRQL